MYIRTKNSLLYKKYIKLKNTQLLRTKYIYIQFVLDYCLQLGLVKSCYFFQLTAIVLYAFGTTSEPGALAAKQPVRRRILENVTVRALVHRNEISIVGRQYILPSVEQCFQVSLNTFPNYMCVYL